MLQLGLIELLILALLSVVLIKPEHIPSLMRSLGSGLSKLKRLQNQISQELSDMSTHKDMDTHNKNVMKDEGFSCDPEAEAMADGHDSDS